MTVGNQATVATVDNILSSLAVQLRDVCDQIKKQATFLNGLGVGGLETVGFVQADAQAVLNSIGYLSTVAGCYYGTVQQGGSGGTGATLFNFDNALSGLWGGA